MWETINETARRVLGRIDQTIEHAMAIDPDRLSGANPCSNVLRVLPRVSTSVRPRPAMPWRDLPSFYAELRHQPETAARALELLLLACCPRTGEVLGATWSEIDDKRWNVPAEHMKSGLARTIPLSTAAVALLDSISRLRRRPTRSSSAVAGAAGQDDKPTTRCRG